MSLAAGTRLGPFEILSVIGAGGMGEVYKAKDTRLDRTVAIKILPSHLSQNAQLKQRFEREARAISSLSHSNICSLYDIGHQEGTDYIVMEYLEGDTLSRRIDKGALPPEQVLRYGVQIAEALDKAHRQGIVHRDLKPGNIILTKSGAKLLDFGLAKLSEWKPNEGADSKAQTNLGPLTEDGVILGTVQYMSPEQVEGKAADERTDIFALGEVLYEMTTGRRTFAADSKAGLMSAILTAQPAPVSSVQPLAPPALDHVIQKCLAKDPEERWQSAHDVASELRWISEQTSQSRMTAPAIAARKFHVSLSWILSGLFLLTTIALGFSFYRYYRMHTGAVSEPELLRLSFQLPENTTIGAPGSLAISPDGDKVAFAVTDKQGRTSLWLRSLDSTDAHELAGSDDAAYPFWSPDSRFVGFFAQGRMKKIDIAGGPAQTICDAPQGRGGAWNRDGKILFTPSVNAGIVLISASEGVPSTPVTTIDKAHQESSHRWPSFLPDGKHFLFTLRSGNAETRGVYLGSLDSKERKRILADSTKAIFAAPGYLFFVRETNLMSVAFNPTTLQMTGEPTVLAQDLDVDAPLSTASFSLSDSHKLIYMNSGSLENQMVWVDRTGKELERLERPGTYFMANLSPDQKTMSVGIPEATTGGYDVWSVELTRGTFSRLTSNPATDTGAIWSPDGTKLIFNSNRNGPFDLYEKPAIGAGDEKLIFHSENYKQANAWSSDGRFIIYEEILPKTNSDLWILPLSGDQKPFPYLATEFNEAHSQFSPDGKWVAYASDETGRPEVYVQSFPIVTGTKRQISTAGGDQPTWRRDQKELFYLASDGRLMSVPVTMTAGFEPGVPTPLFQTHFGYNPIASSERSQYTVTADGQRFLLENLAKLTSETPINVVLNWPALLKK